MLSAEIRVLSFILHCISDEAEEVSIDRETFTAEIAEVLENTIKEVQTSVPQTADGSNDMKLKGSLHEETTENTVYNKDAEKNDDEESFDSSMDELESEHDQEKANDKNTSIVLRTKKRKHITSQQDKIKKTSNDKSNRRNSVRKRMGRNLQKVSHSSNFTVDVYSDSTSKF